jgi:GMP synthase-like glutamine amidotransferase
LTSKAESDPVFGGLPKAFKALQRHSLRVAQPPQEAVLTSSEACQAIRVGSRARSMQYHVKIEENTISNWGKIPA